MSRLPVLDLGALAEFGYTAAVACEKLQALRAEARLVNRQLTSKRQKARAMALQQREHGGRLHLQSDYEVLLGRKLARLDQQITAHLAEHACE